MGSKKTALITGASSGIGKSTAIELAKLGYHIIITGRRLEKLTELKQYIKNNFNVECVILSFDIRDRVDTEKKFESLTDDQKNSLEILVNNAGLALGNTGIDAGVTDDWETMIDTNIKGLLYISNCVIPYFKKNKRGHIINIGSIAGKEVYKNGNVYCATKHAVEALTKGMRIDLLPYNIKVTGICPAATETEFSIIRYKGNEEKAKQVYDGFEPLTAQDIAEIIAFCVSRPYHVNISDILVTPTAQANTLYYHKK